MYLFIFNVMKSEFILLDHFIKILSVYFDWAGQVFEVNGFYCIFAKEFFVFATPPLKFFLISVFIACLTKNFCVYGDRPTCRCMYPNADHWHLTNAHYDRNVALNDHIAETGLSLTFKLLNKLVPKNCFNKRERENGLDVINVAPLAKLHISPGIDNDHV